MNQQLNVPSHVPAHLVRDFNFYFEAPYSEVYARLKGLHDEGEPEIFWSPHNGGHWIVTRGDDVEQVYGNSDLFTTVPHGNAIPYRDTSISPLPINAEVPEHTDYRKVIMPFFAPKKIVEVEKRARAVAGELIDSFIDKDGCEFYEDFSMHVPINVFLGLAGLPYSDWEIVAPLAQSIVREPDMAIALQSAEKVLRYLKEKFDERRVAPRDDSLTAIVQSEVFGRNITEEEVLGTGLMLLVGGVDTTPATITFAAHFLATHPDHRRQLVENPALIPAAVEEFLRRFPAPFTGRGVKKDIEYKGITMKAGDPVLSPVLLANIDERRYEDPMTVDFGRNGLARSLSFGAGVHRCAGATLARMQLKVFLQEWLRRIPDFTLASDDEPRVRCGTAMTITALPLRW